MLEETNQKKQGQKHEGELSLYNEATEPVFAQYLLQLNIKRNGEPPFPVLNDSQKQKAVNKALKNKELTHSLFYQAREYLKQVDYNITHVASNDRFKELTDGQLKGLQVVVNNKKAKGNQKAKKVAEGEKKDDGAKQLQINLNQKIQQELYQQLTPKGKIATMINYNASNNVSFCQFLMSLQPEASNFIQLVSEVMNGEEFLQKRLEIFLAICYLYQGQTLEIDPSLYEPMISLLTKARSVSSTQVVAFLRIAFQNDISFVSVQIPILLAFNDRFAACFDQLYDCLKYQYKEQQDVFTTIPKSILIFSAAMLKTLKKQRSLFAVPLEFLPHIVSIMVNVFTDDKRTFKDCFQWFADESQIQYRAVVDANLLAFVATLNDQVSLLGPLWLHNIKGIKEKLCGVLQLTREGKVPNQQFDDAVCQQLLMQDSYLDTCLNMKQQLKENIAEDLTDFFKTIVIQGKNKEATKNILQSFSPNTPTTKFYRKLIKCMTKLGIQTVSAMQKLCTRLIEHQPFLFLNPGAGTGKSTLLVALALTLSLAECQESVVFVNSDSVLLQRDFDRARELMLHLKAQLSIEFLEDGQTELGDITFMTPLQLSTSKFISPVCVLFDEYQTLFDDSQLVLARVLQMAGRFVGVSGSPIEPEHIKFLLSFVPKALYVQFPEQNSQNISINDVILCKTAAQHSSTVAAIAMEQRVSAPVLLIMDEQQAKRYALKTQKAIGTVTLLFGENTASIAVNAILKQQFTEQINGQYGVFITNRQGGTGVDYPSTAQIEKNGGIRVIICIEPETFGELEQFKKRTGRMENQGIIFFVLNTPPMTTGSAYLETLKEILKKNEVKSIRKLQHQFDTLFKDKQQIYIQQNNDVCKSCYGEFAHVGECQVKESSKQGNDDVDMQQQDLADNIEEEGEKTNGSVDDVCKKGCEKLAHIGPCQCHECGSNGINTDNQCITCSKLLVTPVQKLVQNQSVENKTTEVFETPQAKTKLLKPNGFLEIKTWLRCKSVISLESEEMKQIHAAFKLFTENYAAVNVTIFIKDHQAGYEPVIVQLSEFFKTRPDFFAINQEYLDDFIIIYAKDANDAIIGALCLIVCVESTTNIVYLSIPFQLTAVGVERTGVGARLLNTVIEFAQSLRQQYQVIHLLVCSIKDSPSANSFYTKMGFISCQNKQLRSLQLKDTTLLQFKPKIAGKIQRKQCFQLMNIQANAVSELDINVIETILDKVEEPGDALMESVVPQQYEEKKKEDVVGHNLTPSTASNTKQCTLMTDLDSDSGIGKKTRGRIAVAANNAIEQLRLLKLGEKADDCGVVPSINLGKRNTRTSQGKDQEGNKRRQRTQ